MDADPASRPGAIAETGSTILCPDTHEFRPLSLVPPSHIVLLGAGRSAALRAQDWVK
jgi:hypothetical protein